MMVAVAVLMAFELDIRFQTAIADDLPAVLVNPSRELEASAAARERLAELRGGGGGALAQAAEAGGDEGSELPVLGEAPEIVETQQWFNTRGNRPLSLASLRGRAVLVDFWRYSCINCVRTLPYLRAWDARYRERGLTVIGVHAPEFSIRARPEQRRACGPQQRDSLPGRAGQRVRDLERLRQPVLACEVLDRRARARALHTLR
jgi:thiol-disulfide isomerase/thioredoxin